MGCPICERPLEGRSCASCSVTFGEDLTVAVPFEFSHWRSFEEQHGSDEFRAAVTMMLATGTAPRLRDVQGPGSRDGDIDLELFTQDGGVELAEVTATTNRGWTHEQRTIAREAERMVPTWRMAWHLDVPSLAAWNAVKRLIPTLLMELEAEGATSLAATQPTSEALRLVLAAHPGIVLYGGVRPEPSRMLSASRGMAGSVRDASDWVGDLSELFGTDLNLRRHVEKLVAAQASAPVGGRHLYLLIAAAGIGSSILSALMGARLPEGDLVLDEQVSDVWLDGGTGRTLRWRRGLGWVGYGDGFEDLALS